MGDSVRWNKESKSNHFPRPVYCVDKGFLHAGRGDNTMIRVYAFYTAGVAAFVLAVMAGGGIENAAGLVSQLGYIALSVILLGSGLCLWALGLTREREIRSASRKVHKPHARPQRMEDERWRA
jgi:hypothetical protein